MNRDDKLNGESRQRPTHDLPEGLPWRVDGSKMAEKLVHPTGFEPVTSAFGAVKVAKYVATQQNENEH